MEDTTRSPCGRELPLSGNHPLGQGLLRQTPARSFPCRPPSIPRPAGGSRWDPTYLSANVQGQGLRLVVLHLAAAPAGEREGGAEAGASGGCAVGGGGGACDTAQAGGGSPSPSSAPAASQRPHSPGKYRGTASSGTNRRNEQIKHTTTQPSGLSLRRLFLRR